MHKFKLKKDGKVVGYCKWTENWGWKYSSANNDFEDTFTHFAVAQAPKGIAAHPFVCTDKNGDEVYLDSDIVEYTYTIENDVETSEKTIRGTVVLDLDFTNSLCVKTKGGLVHHFTASETKNIELVKD